MLRPASLVPALVLALGTFGSAALAAPRVGVVVSDHAGLTDEQAEEVAYDVAAAVAQRIDGEAIAGTQVREAIGALAAGCEDRPDCARGIAAKLKTDEALFLVLKKVGKKDIDVTAHRIARDPERVPTDGHVRLAGLKAKREAALQAAIATLYPTGSVVPFVDPNAKPPASDISKDETGDDDDTGAAATDKPVRKKKKVAIVDDGAPQSEGGSITKRKWFWPVIAVGGTVVLGGIIAISIVETRPGPTGAPITLP